MSFIKTGTQPAKLYRVKSDPDKLYLKRADLEDGRVELLDADSLEPKVVAREEVYPAS